MHPPIFRRMFGYNLALLPNAHLARLEEGVSSIEEAREKSGATIGYPGWGLIYYMLLSHLDRSKAETIIETGTNQGCTTIVLAQALIDSGVSGHVHTFELDLQNVTGAQRNLKAAGVDHRVKIHEGDVRTTLPPAIAKMQNVRFAFLDASHLEQDVLFEFDTILPHLAPDAIVVFDNTYAISEPGEDPRVNGALKKLLRGLGGNLINFEHVSWFTPGLAIWQRVPSL